MQISFVQRIASVLIPGIFLVICAVSISGQNMFRKMNDFDGDGKTDFAVTRTEGNSKVWYIWQSQNGFRAFYWGIGGDMLAPGDYDGDGKTDIAVFRPVNFPPFVHRFWIWNSGSNNFTTSDFTHSDPSNAPMQQDFNGDGKTDPAVWIGSIIEPPGSTTTNVAVKYSGTDTINLQYQVPPQTAPIRTGDMTGDGRADNVQRAIGGINITDISTNTTRFVQFGISGDQFVPGDFDGDGIGDVAIWRSSDGNWWWIRSSDNTVRVVNWGTNGDKPVTGDYDGDGITDLAIWRPGSSQSYYWVLGSQSGAFVFGWGISTDQVVTF